MKGHSSSRTMDRRQFLGMVGTVGAGFALSSVLSACGAKGGSSPGSGTAGGASGTAAKDVKGELRWMTWSDHYVPDQLAKVAQTTGITSQPTLFSDNIDGFTKLKQVPGQFDLISGDALWIPQYFKADLVEPLDLGSVDASKELYPLVKDMTFWKNGSQYLGFPFSWSPQQISYNPKHVTGKPDSWEVLWDAKYRKKIVMEKQPTDVMAMMGRAVGVKDPYNMTDDELKKAKDALVRLMPNMLKFVEQNQETVKAMADESAWISITNLGQADRVKDAGGPEVISFIAKEGTVGFIDAEMIVKGGNRARALAFLNAAERAEWVAKNFLENGRPLFNEKAYKLLVDQGQKDRADRYLYNQPETSAKMTLKGPAGNEQAYVDAFNAAIAG